MCSHARVPSKELQAQHSTFHRAAHQISNLQQKRDQVDLIKRTVLWRITRLTALADGSLGKIF